MFWLSYECFSISCDAFLLKNVISSHNSCVLLEVEKKESKTLNTFQKILE